MSDTRVLVSVPRFAHLCDISESTARRLIAAGTVRTVRVGHSVRVPAEEISRLAGKPETDTAA